MDQLQDDAQAKEDLRELDRLKGERGPYETAWREIDDRYPSGDGGFNKKTPGAIRGQQNFDMTHVTALGRFAAAGVAITTPEEKQYIRPRFQNPDLQKLRSVQLWCQRAGQRLYDIRHMPHTGFTVAANEDWDQLGRYGTSPMWSEARPTRGMFYRTLHLSQCYIDVDFANLVDVFFRELCWTARQCEQFFGLDALTPKMRKCLQDDKAETEFQIVHVVRPNTAWDRDKMDWRRYPVAERYLALDERIYLRRRGFQTMPVSVSRHMTSAGEKYGRSPGTNTLPTVNGLNAMRLTILRAGHKAVDPALVFYDDEGLSSLATKPGGLNPGFVDESGRLLIHRVPGGEQALPFVAQDIDGERQAVKTEFLEEFYKILTDPNSRMTTTEVIEVMQKQGVLVRPFAGRYAMEKQYPVSNRDLQLAMEARQIEPFPPEVIEAGAWPIIDYENPLAAMARAESTGKTLRFVEAITPIAQVDGGAVFDYLNTDEMIPGMAEEIGVKPQYVRSPEEVAAIRAARAQQQQQAQSMEQVAQAADAYQKIAKGNAMSEAA